MIKQLLFGVVAFSAVVGGVPANAATSIGTATDISVYTNPASGQSFGFVNGGYAGSAGTGEVSRNYLKFNLSVTPGTFVSSAILNLNYFDSYDGALFPLTIYGTSDSFTNGTNWSAKPALGVALATFNPQTPGVYSFDVTSYVNSEYLLDGVVSFAIAATDEYFTGGTPNSWRYFAGGTQTLSLETAATTSPVPEPATWALMLAGFGVVGAAMRKSRQQRMRVTHA